MLYIIENDPDVRLRAQTAFFRHTFNTRGVSGRTLHRIERFTPADVAYVPRLDSFKHPLELCRRFKELHPDLPLAVKLPNECVISRAELDDYADNVIRGDTSVIYVLEILCELSRMYSRKDSLSCQAGPLFLNIYTPTVHVRDFLFSFTRASISVLRHLAEAYPRPVTAKELAACTGAPGRPHSPSCVSTILSRINQRIEAETGSPLVLSCRGAGYTILPY